MAQTIQIKRGSGSSVPSSLAEAELAINLDSGKLYYGSGSSVSSDFTFDSITAETYVISSSVTHMTTSFSSGSTAFGDSSADQHTFTGNITASGNISSSNNFYSKRAYLYDDESSYLASGTNPILHLKNTNAGTNADTYIKFESTDNGSHYSLGIDTSRNTFVIGSGSYLTQDSSPPFSLKDDKIAINKVGGLPSYTLDVTGDIRCTDDLFVNDDATITGDLDVDGTTNLDAVDIDGNVDVTGAITASGNISSSAYIYGDRIYAGPLVLGISPSADTLQIGFDQTINFLEYGKSATISHLFKGTITASGHISSSGTVIGLTGSFNQLSVLSSGDTDTPPLEGHLLRVTDTTNNNPDIEHFFAENQGLAYGMRWKYDGGDNDFKLYRHNNDAAGTPVIAFNRGDDNITMYGQLSGISTLKGSTDSDLSITSDSDIIYKTDDDGDELGKHIFKERTTTLLTLAQASASFTVPVKDGGRTIIKILPHNFVANDGGRPVQIEDDSIGSNELFAFSHSDFDMYAYIEIPYGMTATHVKIFGSNTGENFTVYEANITNKTIAAKCSATAIESEADITDVPWTDANYLVILITSAGATDEIHGGYVKIEPS